MFKLGSFALAFTGLVACSPNSSTIGQRITCETDPDSGVILSCEPGEGDGGENTCEDIDEDGDGMPDDDDDDDGDDDGTDDGGDGELGFTSSPTEGGDEEDDHDEDGDGVCDGDDHDDDDDGIDDDDDCDEEEGGDSDESELPYDIKMQLGQQ